MEGLSQRTWGGILTFTALRPQRARTESAQSPPAAPPCFNPPAESPPDPAASITPPSSAEPSPQASTSNIHDLINSSSGPTSPASVIPRRPDLRAVQRLSDDVILSSPGTESQGSTSGSPAGSEGGEHLQEMRDRLLSESSGSTATRRDSDPTPRQSMDINVIAPTPPLPPEEEQPTSSPEAGPSRLRNSPLSAHSPQLQSFDAVSATEHSWDSVVSLSFGVALHPVLTAMSVACLRATAPIRARPKCPTLLSRAGFTVCHSHLLRPSSTGQSQTDVADPATGIAHSEESHITRSLLPSYDVCFIRGIVGLLCEIANTLFVIPSCSYSFIRIEHDAPDSRSSAAPDQPLCKLRTGRNARVHQ